MVKSSKWRTVVIHFTDSAKEDDDDLLVEILGTIMVCSEQFEMKKTGTTRRKKAKFKTELSVHEINDIVSTLLNEKEQIIAKIYPS